MNDLTPVFDKLQKIFGTQDTLGAMKNARTWGNRVEQALIEQSKKKPEIKKEPSMQEILYEIKKDMGEETKGNQSPEHEEEQGLEI